eukprot:CAMPEP_0181367814 /NCGR_PEP_ID=MMETSP1106-20121128/11675_1 /TAXON_ID=81844 /ORGANISM="Mantoniella antarctica, Strain SL-175" /LENGTH=256 /DNA_ID=CAMNT_0023483729 /DNA_START=165 /DNA_END=935 /DNA_ORIENTATION=-
MNLVGVLGALAAGSAGFAAAALKVGGGSGREVTSANKTLVRKLYREVWNQADSVKAKASAGKFISEEHILIDPSHPNPSPGVDAYLEGVLSLREALSSIVIVVDDLVAQGLKVVAQLSFKASAGGREARWTGTAIMEIEDGQVVKTWINSDIISAMIQLGLLQDFMSSQIERTGARISAGAAAAAAGKGGSGGAHFSDGDLKVVQALLGRSEAHPTSVLTGNEWLAYFDNVSTTEDDGGRGSMLRVDSKTGLDVVV